MSYDKAALELELEGYIRRGLKDRADQVRALLGIKEDKPVEQASAAPGEKRSTRRG